ncbi:hypothetical protein FE257_009594 [Aspergillus nanangensis]|uniref:Major facilitator superfamily (MFS) profile domain-containing protein n=1 Tax=Aspergillus nanangensis TaxID=2582783 RepID=A0AAD4GTU7_ASPNN|nr:hypothetical protein FE257_009594 [Aspergillus nanangensis]
MEDPEKRDTANENSEKSAVAELHPQPSTEEIVLSSGPEKPLFPETDLSRGIVGWDGQKDPANPQNFSSGRKWGLLALMTAITFLSPLASSMFAPAVSYVGEDLNVTDETLLSLSVSIFLLGYVVGPLVLAPLSEIYGRRIILSCGNWFFVVWQIACALAPNIASLVVFRFLSGMGASACLTLGAALIADIFPVEKRGLATSVWSGGPLFGPILGPIIGGFVGEAAGWRWVFWILLIAGGVIATAIEFLNQETYARVLIRWKTEKLKKELQRPDLRSAYEHSGEGGASVIQTLQQGLRRPMVLLFKSPIVALLATYMSLTYGLLYLFFTTIPSVFMNQYGFSTGISGLAYLGLGIGSITGITVVASTSDKAILKLTSRNGGRYEPEMRLPMMVIFACILPISFFWYGWSAEKEVHWIVPIIGMAPFGFGMLGVYLPMMTYIIDCFPEYAASANATMTATRSLVGTLLPLAGPKMFATLGLGWGNSLLGFVALAFVPAPMIFIKYGKIIREKFPVNLDGKKT